MQMQSFGRQLTHTHSPKGMCENMSLKKTASGSSVSDLRDVVNACTSRHISASSWNFWNLQGSDGGP
jgi:hypothetical protein